MLEKFPLLQSCFDKLRVKYSRVDHLCLYWHIRLLDFQKKNPILIYQMGKVGSSSVWDSLLDAKLDYHIYHIHYLTRPMHRDSEKQHKKRSQKLPDHIPISKALKIKVQKDLHALPWKIISLVRDPVKREISSRFEIAYLFQKELKDQQGNWSVEKIKKYIEDDLSNFDEDTNFCCNWFDFELKSVFGIDIYDYPFPKDIGYQIIKENNVELIILRLEDLNKTFAGAMKKFLELDKEIPLTHTNLAKEKDYFETYKNVSKNLNLTEDQSRKIYNSKFVRHFYSGDAREKMIRQWVR